MYYRCSLIPIAKEQLSAAVSKACERSTLHGRVDISRFETEFAKELAELLHVYGAKPVFRSLLRYESKLEIPCSISYLEEEDFYLPNRIEEVDRCIDEAILDNSTSVRSYRVHGVGLYGPCELALTREVVVRIPSWEARAIIRRNINRIENDRLFYLRVTG